MSKLSDTDRWMIRGFALEHYARTPGDIIGNTPIKLIEAQQVTLNAPDPSTYPPQMRPVTVTATDRVGQYLVGYNYLLGAIVVFKPEK